MKAGRLRRARVLARRTGPLAARAVLAHGTGAADVLTTGTVDRGYRGLRLLLTLVLVPLLCLVHGPNPIPLRGGAAFA